MEQLNKKHIYEIITKRFIEAAPNAQEESAVKSAMTKFTAEKYVYAIEGFKHCQEAWEYLYHHYDTFGEDSKVKMLHLYASEFRTLNSEDKIKVIKTIESGNVKSAGILQIICYF